MHFNFCCAIVLILRMGMWNLTGIGIDYCYVGQPFMSALACRHHLNTNTRHALSKTFHYAKKINVQLFLISYCSSKWVCVQICGV